LAVLIVEGEPWLSLDISEALDDEGYDVISVAYPDNAIEALEARNDIHTVLTDLDVRGSMDGLKLAAAVRERWPPVNVIVSTGNGKGAPRRDEIPARALFIAKPYRSAEVV
jgi:DNA-binding NtrC family response regulator